MIANDVIDYYYNYCYYYYYDDDETTTTTPTSHTLHTHIAPLHLHPTDV